MDVKEMESIYLAHDTDHWRDFVNMEMNFGFL
jgi:hypothetical protein